MIRKNGLPCDSCKLQHSCPDVKQQIFLEQLHLAPKVPKHKQARDAKRIIEQARRAPFLDGGPYKNRFLSEEWKEAIIASNSKIHDDSKMKLVVAREWRRLGIDNYLDAERIEQCIYWACFNRFINASNLHLRRLWGP